MASSFLALLDDIATLMDDVAVMTKLATKKTSGIIADDLALNAEQVSGIDPNRELPIVWKIFLGSLLNKIILIPFVLILMTFFPKILMGLLMLGGFFLCYEGSEKVLHKLFHKKCEVGEKVVVPESEKIKGAIRTDFILSGEILVLATGVMQSGSFSASLISLVCVGALVSILTYGFVALIIKIDDAGLLLLRKGRGFSTVGKSLIWFAPVLMRTLGIVGTIAMFMVGAPIIVHGLEVMGFSSLHHLINAVDENAGSLVKVCVEISLGVVFGLVVVGVLKLIRKVRNG